MHFSFSHDFDIDPEGFWKMFFSEPFENELFRRLKMRTHVVLERKDEGNQYRRKVKLEPEAEVPSWAQAVVRDTGYTEHDLLHRDRSVMDVTIEPALMKDRFHMSGSFKVTPLGPGRCRREFAGEVRVSVPLLGGKIEKFMVDKMREGYDVAAEFTREWLRRQPAPAQS
jgi:hypothetical protein